MPKKIEAEVISRTLAVYHFITTCRKIVNHQGIIVPRNTVNRVISAEGRKDQRKTIKKKSAKSWNVQLIRKKRFVNKVVKALNDNDPLRQKNLAGKYKVS